MKIVMIGPVFPYKGGIAHYTSLMYQNLIKYHDVSMISYKLQYPKFLYRKEQKDFENENFRVDGTEYLIHTANPFNWLSSAGKIKKLCPDLVIIQWWHPYFSPCYWVICKLLKRIKILFLCHNVFPHERFPMDRILTKHVLKQGDCFIVQSAQDEADLKSIRADAVYSKTVLPTFNAFKLQNMSSQKAREQLRLSGDKQVLLFFGFVRKYKGLTYLLQAMPRISRELPNVKLLIVGDFGSDKHEYLKMIQGRKIQEYIEIHDGYIPDKEVEKFFAASDVVVLPYESATQSGIVQIAYGFEKPVIASDVGGLPEVVIDEKTGFITKAKDSDDLAEKIIRFFNEKRADEFRNEIVNEADKYSWDHLSRIVEEQVRRIRE